MDNTVLQPSSSPAAGGVADAVIVRDISPRRFGDALLYLAILGLVIRLGFFIEHARDDSFGVPTLDQTYYDTVARMILAGEDLHQLHGFRPLLYPMFLASIYKIGGLAGVPLAIAAQHLLGIATGVMVALLGARVFRNRLCGLAGGILFLLAPVPLYFEGELLIESSYIFLIILALVVHFRAAGNNNWAGAVLWLAVGALMGLAAQARANILIFFAAYPMFAVWRWLRMRGWNALLPLLGLAGAMAMMILWGCVNMRQSDTLQFIPSQGGVALFLGNKRMADGMIPEQGRRTSYDQRYEDSIEVWAREEYERAVRARNLEPGTAPAAVSHFWTQRAVAEIKADPAAWLRLMTKKCWLTFWNAEVPNNKSFAFLQDEFAWLRWLPVRWVVLLALAPAGIWAAWKWGDRDAGFLLLIYAGLYSAGNVAFFICDRYRYPVWPAMAVFAGGGFGYLLASIRARKLVATMGALAGMAVIVAVSLPNWFHARMPTYARDYFFRSLAELDKGHLDTALVDIDRSIALDPCDANAPLQRGNILFAQDKLADACAAFKQALAINPGEPGAWNNLGNTLDALGRPDEALTAFQSATHCDPPSQNAFLGITHIQIRRGRLGDAARTLDELQSLAHGQSALALATRAVLERRRGNEREADTLERQAAQKDAGALEWVTRRISPSGKSK